MSHYEHLSVFKSTYDLLLMIYKTTKNFDREYKYTIGENLKSKVLELLILIHKINSIQDITERKKFLIEAISYGEEIKLLNRVCKDIGILQLKQFALLSEKEVEILKQLEAWKGSYK